MHHPELVVAEAVVVVVQQDGAMFSVLEFAKDAVYDADTVAAAVAKDAGVQVRGYHAVWVWVGWGGVGGGLPCHMTPKIHFEDTTAVLDAHAH